MGNSHEVMTLAEARQRFSGQWLGLEVVSRDENGRPLKVRVRHRAGTRLQLRDKVREMPDVYITFAGPVVPAGQGILY